MLGEPTPLELDLFLLAWQRAIQAEREECAKVCEAQGEYGCQQYAAALRARGQA